MFLNASNLYSFPGGWRPADSETLQPDAGLNRQEEALLIYNYTTQTCRTIAGNEEELEIWRITIFQDCGTSSCLLDVTLGLASLHRILLAPTTKQKYAQAAIHYQHRALQSYTQELRLLNGENCHVLLACSILLSVLAMSMSAGHHEMTPTPAVETLSSACSLLVGARTVTETYSAILMSTPYRTLLEQLPLYSDPMAGEDVGRAMQELRWYATNAQVNDPWQIEKYHSAIDALDQSFERLARRMSIGAILVSLSTTNAPSTDFLREHDCVMMLILVHYGALYIQLDTWWAREYGSRLVQELSHRLHSRDEKWISTTRWARSKAVESLNFPDDPGRN